MNFAAYQSMFHTQKAPFAWVEMDALDENILSIAERAKGKNIRLATKSIRCRFILSYILDKLPYSFGLMSFTVEESIWLAEKGFTNILLGYPTLEVDLVEKVVSNPQLNAAICFMVDSLVHVEILNQTASKYQTKANICVDVDMSTHFPGIYFGVFRSSIQTKRDLENLLEKTKDFANITWKGMMGYEAQIAGVGDNFPKNTLMNGIIRFLKRKSLPKIAQRRAKCLAVFKNKGIELQFVNGGGTGSIESTLKEKEITEITVGSGFFQSHLFDNYANFTHRPAVFYALRIVRNPKANIFTALGGGYIASVATDSNKQPQPFWPEGMKLIKNEGAGEVQTPFEYRGKIPLKVGDLVFFRHAKAGELCERFNELILVRKGKIEQIVPTYRGEQKSFL
jgi:D-serine deaminase-like pyridoxal phosphate-dependent protein